MISSPRSARDRSIEDVASLSGDPIVNEARQRSDRCQEWYSTSDQRFLEDIKFAYADSDNGYQWPNDVRNSRDIDKRPCLTMNVVRQHNLQISNEARQAKASPQIVATSGGASEESAKAFRWLLSHIEFQSNAQACYTTARSFQIAAGKGYWRLVTDWASPDSFDQEIYIRPVQDPLSVRIDPDARQRDKSDARFALVFDIVPRKELFDAYPEIRDQVADTSLGVSSGADWVPKDEILVCEYFRKVPKYDTLISFVFQGVRHTIRKSKVPPEILDDLLEDKLTKTRETWDDEVEWYLIVGDKVVDETIWMGKYIPLVEIIGEETIIDGIYDCKGHTRALKDAQRMFNYNAALSINTKIPTPFGWTTMGQLEDGDWVFDQNGEPIQVAKALPVKIGEECFKVKFDNGYSVVTDGGHIWQVEERGKRRTAGFDWEEKTVSTSELTAGKHFIKISEPLNLFDKELTIDPYLLGLWLGDGDKNGVRISAHVDDAEEEKLLLGQLGYTTGDCAKPVGKGTAFHVLGMRAKFTEEGLLGEKHIPAKYLRASYNQRLALLQGLMDSDGHFHEKVNQCIFVNGDEFIAKGFLELCASLGLKTTFSVQSSVAKEAEQHKYYISKKTYRIQFTADPSIPVFRLSRKVSAQTKDRPTHWRRTKRLDIVSIEKVESVPVRCIMLETKEHLYLCGEGMIPTHNSAQVEFGALQSKTPWVAPIEAIGDFMSVWETANLINHSFLPYKQFSEQFPEQPIQAPQRIEPPVHAPAFKDGMDVAFSQMMMTSGQWQNQMGMQGNERTGAAIEKRQGQGDTATFHFQDNYAEGLRATAKQLIDLCPKVYDTKRAFRIMTEEGTEVDLILDPKQMQAYKQELDQRQQVIRRIFNPSVGVYDVAADVGPAIGTRREQNVEAFMVLLAQAPALTGIIGDLLLKNMPFEDAQEAARRLRRMVPPQALGEGPTPTEQQLREQLVAAQTALAKTMYRAGADRIKIHNKEGEQALGAYDAETKRMTALAAMLPEDAEGLSAMIEQLVQDTLATHLLPMLEDATSGVMGPAEGPDAPPMPGAQRAPDGEWYLTDPTRSGKYLRVVPLAQKRKARGVVENA